MSYSLTFSKLVGEFIVDKELFGQQDPYVIFESGGNKCQTKAIKNVGAGTAEWKETYTLREFSTKTSSILEVTVLNHNTLRPDGAIGIGRVDLAKLSESQLSGSGERVKVQLLDKKEKNVGFLQFYINGGGYTGAGRSAGTGAGYGTSGTTTGAGYGTSGTTTGAGYGTSGTTTGAGYGTSGTATGAGYGTSGTSGYTGSGTTGSERITGVGAGSTYSEAKSAADKAALEGSTVRTGTGAVGRPVGGDGYDGSRTTGTGYDSTTSGTGTRSTLDISSFKASGIRGVDVAAGEIIDRKYYTGVETRPQDQALIERHREHAPYAKQYETVVCHTGRERLIRSNIEALGTTERIVESDHIVHSHPHDQILRVLPKGSIATRATGEGWIDGSFGPVCEAHRFEITGDRVIIKERVTNLREHREFEKEFEVKTVLIGERSLPAIEIEQLHRERVLVNEKAINPCAGSPIIESSKFLGGVIQRSGYLSGGSTVGATTGEGYRGTTGTGTTGGYSSTTGTGTTGATTGVTSSGTTGQTTGTGRTPQYA